MSGEWFAQLRFLLFGKNRAEVDEELQFHLEHLVTSKIAAGASPEEARRQARIEFGGIEAVREQCQEQRPSHIFETLTQDIRYALRGFLRSPGRR